MPKFAPEVKEYALVLAESMRNISVIARNVKDRFNLETEIEPLRRNISNWIKHSDIERRKVPIRRLFFDIETSYFTVPVYSFGKVYVGSDYVFREKKIICICYKWQGSDEVHSLVWNQKKQDDSKLIKDFIQVIKKADEMVAHNGDRFDIRELRTRALLTKNLMFPVYRTLDTLKKSRQYFRFPSNKLDYLAKVMTGEGKTGDSALKLGVAICEHNDLDALNSMVEYCKNDVIILEDVYTVISPYIYHNTNMAVIHGGDKWHCPECTSDNVQFSHLDATAMGYIKRHMKCNDCRKFFKISNRTYLSMLESMHR